MPVEIKPIRKVQDWFLNPKDMEDSLFLLKPNVCLVGSVEIDPRSPIWNLLKLSTERWKVTISYVYILGRAQEIQLKESTAESVQQQADWFG